MITLFARWANDQLTNGYSAGLPALISHPPLTVSRTNFLSPSSSHRSSVVSDPAVKEVRRLLADARGDRLEALYVLAIHCGLRRGELLGLRWSDVDLDTGTLRVSRQLQRMSDGSGLVFSARRRTRPAAQSASATRPQRLSQRFAVQLNLNTMSILALVQKVFSVTNVY